MSDLSGMWPTKSSMAVLSGAWEGISSALQSVITTQTQRWKKGKLHPFWLVNNMDPAATLQEQNLFRRKETPALLRQSVNTFPLLLLLLTIVYTETFLVKLLGL